MKIHNTLTGKKEELTGKTIGLYVCGPTVYDESHIGHARSAYVFDYLVRYLRSGGFKVKFVRNVTDVDDKIIERAKHGLIAGLARPKYADYHWKHRVSE